MNDSSVIDQRWVAFGPTGAVGSILRSTKGFVVQMIREDADRGVVYPSLDAAKGALHRRMGPGSERPEFREH